MDFISRFPANMQRSDYAKTYGKQVAELYKHCGDPTPTEAMGQEICRLQYDLQLAKEEKIKLIKDHKRLQKIDMWFALFMMVAGAVVTSILFLNFMSNQN